MDIKEDVDANAKEDLVVRDRIRYQWMLESVASSASSLPASFSLCCHSLSSSPSKPQIVRRDGVRF
jgi:hypothetical protein